jgi:DNA/RNA-binding domain of Phe-tRNA-synthetase-like protein
VRQLRDLSNRYRGGGVVAMRTKPVPQAYRAFFRQIGLDPDVRRIPSEEVAVARLIQGGFRSVDHIADACLVALIETGVPVWALDADRLEGEVGLRGAERGERLGGGEYAHELPAGRLVLADDAGPVGVLFGALAPGRGVGPRTTRITLLALQVAGVPDIHVEEALWTVADAIG